MPKQGPIVIIENDTDDHEILQLAFIELNIKNRLIFFESGGEALQYLSTTTDQPFIILTDINMPKMSGVELRREIFKHEELRKKSIPFIFLTTYADAKLVEKAYELSVQGFYQKPTSYDELKLILKLIV